jgi:DNA end-binding protein Ku
MKIIWSGSLTFFLVNIPVRLYNATREEQFDLDMLHKKDLSPIRYARICKLEEKEVPYEDIVKGYEYEKGRYIVLTEEDFKKANRERTQTISISGFAEEDEIESLFYQKPYYLEPGKGAEKPYALLREALRKTKKVGIARFVLRNKERLCIIRPEASLLLLNQVRFMHEILSPEGLNLPSKELASGEELELAVELINKARKSFKPAEYPDTYDQEIEKVIAGKLSGKMPRAKGKVLKPTRSPELMAALKKSLAEKSHRSPKKEKAKA